MMLLLIFCCGIVSFFFKGVESGLLSLDPVRLRENVKRGVPAALRLNRLLEHQGRLLVTVLLFTNAADILGLLLLTRLLIRAYGNIGFVLSLIIALPVYLFLLGVLPKALFRRFPFRALAFLAGVLEFVTMVLWPFLAIGAQIGRIFLPRQPDRRNIFAAREELKQITAQSEREGSISATERAMIHNVFDFSSVKVRDVMVPLEKVAAVSPNQTVDEAIALSVASGLDRLPVVSASGEPKGLINILDVLMEKNGDRSLGRFMRRIVVAGEDEPAYRIVQRLRAARLGLAAVLDRHHQLRGIVAIEDLIQRLVSISESRS